MQINKNANKKVMQINGIMPVNEWKINFIYEL